MHFVIPVLTSVFRSTNPVIGALSVPFGILPFTDVFGPSGIGNCGLSVRFAIPVFTDEFVPIEKGHIGLQAESAELLYRNIRIKELDGNKWW